jgi:epoxyqueuosine reductase
MTTTFDEKKLRAEITDEIARIVREEPANRLDLDNLPIFGPPLVGFASGTDPIFSRLKEVIGPFHLTPVEAIGQAASSRGNDVPHPESTGVISYVLPMYEDTVRSNASMKDGPSRRWMHGKYHGERFGNLLSDRIISYLREKGFLAVSPAREPDLCKITRDPRVGFASTWSERHVAYAAGLGTFGLSDGLITEAGIAHVVGSVVVNIPFTSPGRPADIHAACLFYRKGACKACAKRCPAGAISDAGHDKDKCARFAFSQTPINKERYGIEVYGCGLCLSGVPCAMKNPGA